MGKDIKKMKIAVIGAGSSGIGVALHFATNHFPVVLCDIFDAALIRAKERIQNSVTAMMEEDFLTAEQAEQANACLSYTMDYKAAASGADLVVECVQENVTVKQDIFSLLDRICSHDTIIASTTSAMNIFDLIKVKRAERIVVLNYFTPMHLMPCVEIVPGPSTSQETTDTVKQLMELTGKQAMVLKDPVPGFLVNRLTFALMREALYMIEQGWCTMEELDKAIVSTYGPRFAIEGLGGLIDNAGIDLYAAISATLMDELCDSKNTPKTFTHMLRQGKVGVKAGEGFYKYGPAEQVAFQREKKLMKMMKAIRQVDESC